MAKLLSPEEEIIVHNRCKENDLYRHWSPILAKLQRDYGEMNTASIWSLAEQKISHLRKATSYREQDIPVIYNELLRECSVLSQKGCSNKERTSEQARQTATTVMCVIFTLLLNAIEKDHEEDFFNNEPMCMAILDILKDDVFFNTLMKYAFDRNIGYDGKKVVITPHDPMLENETDEFSLKEKAIKQVLESYNLINKAACAVLLSADRKRWLKKRPTYKEACEKFGKRWSKDTYIYMGKEEFKVKQEELNLADDRLEEALENLSI